MKGIGIKQRSKDLLMDVLYSATSRLESNYVPSPTEISNFKAVLKKNIHESQAAQLPAPKIRVFNDVIFHPNFKALYDKNGSLIRESAIVRWRPDNFIGAPNRIDPVADIEIKNIDIAVYGGILFDNHFGHFICESMSRLWPLVEENVDNVIQRAPWLFATSSGKQALDVSPPFLTQTMSSLKRLGMMPQVENQPVFIRRALVPDAAHQIGIAGHPIFRELCRKIGGDILSRSAAHTDASFEGERVYLSRAQLSSNRRRIAGEAELAQLLQENGFKVVYPERLPFRDQIALFSGAHTIIGCIGSAFHTQIFAPRIQPQLVCITDEKPSLTYFNFDAMCSTSSIYVLGLSESSFRSKYVKHQVLSMKAIPQALGLKA